MNRITYDVSIALGLFTCTGGTVALAGMAWGAIVFGGGLIALTVIGALLGGRG